MLSFLNWHEYVIVINHPSSLRALNHSGTYEIDTLLQISDNCWHLDNPDFMIFTLQPWHHPFYRKKRDFCLICEKPVIQTVTINRHINKPASSMSKLSNHAVKAIESHGESCHFTPRKLSLHVSLPQNAPKKRCQTTVSTVFAFYFANTSHSFRKDKVSRKNWYSWHSDISQHENKSALVCISLHQRTVW